MSNINEKNFKFVKTNDGIKLEIYYGDDKEVIIPSEVDGQKVTSIGDCAFRASNIEKIYFPNTIKTIGENAFEKCLNLYEINLPDSITSIGESAFSYCTKLTNVKLPKNLECIEKSSFYLTNIKEISLPENLKYIKSSAFSESALEKIYFPNSLKLIKNNAFSSCFYLCEINFEEGIEYIGKYAFDDCKLEKICFPSSLKYIDDNAFIHCGNLSEVEFKKDIEYIGDKAFEETNVKSINFLDRAEPIEKFYPYEKTSKKEVKSILVKETDKEVVDKKDDVTVAKMNSITKVIPLKDIDKKDDCIKTKSVITLSEIVSDKKIDYADIMNKQVKDLFYDDFIMNDEKTILKACVDFDREIIEIPESVVEIENKAFWNIKNIKEVIIGNNVQIIGEYAFSEYDIQKITVKKDNRFFKSDENCLYRILYDGTEELLYCFNKNLVRYVMPENLVRIPNFAFDNYSTLREVVFNDKLKYIGDFAFRETKILNLSFPKTLEYIGRNAFRECENLIKVEFSKDCKVEQILTNTFYRCTNLKEVILHEGLVDINDNAFRSTNIQKISFPSTLKCIGESAFSMATLKEIEFKEGLEKIGKDAFEFARIRKISFPSTLKSIGQGSFSYCGYLSEVIFKEGIESIGDYAFMKTEIREITIPKSLVHKSEHAFDLEEEEDDFIILPSCIPMSKRTLRRRSSMRYRIDNNLE